MHPEAIYIRSTIPPIVVIGSSTLGKEIKVKGSINADTDKDIDVKANLRGLDSEIALAAYAATATGGVIAEKTAK